MNPSTNGLWPSNSSIDGIRAGGTGTIHVNDELVARGKIGHTVPFLFSADETMDVGGDLAMPVADDYPEGESNKFNGVLRVFRSAEAVRLERIVPQDDGAFVEAEVPEKLSSGEIVILQPIGSLFRWRSRIGGKTARRWPGSGNRGRFPATRPG